MHRMSENLINKKIKYSAEQIAKMTLIERKTIKKTTANLGMEESNKETTEPKTRQFQQCDNFSISKQQSKK